MLEQTRNQHENRGALAYVHYTDDFLNRRRKFQTSKTILEVVIGQMAEEGTVPAKFSGEYNRWQVDGDKITDEVFAEVVRRHKEQLACRSTSPRKVRANKPVSEIEPVRVLFSRDGFMALSKPAGICSQGPKTGPLELWELVRLRHPNGSIAHRIDKFTTGINLAGETRENLSYLQKNWHSITRKVYLAIIEDPAWDERVVDSPIDGKTAVTSFRVLERRGRFALIRCELVQNGRTHQIRRHLKSLGNPIAGDRKYQGPKSTAREGQLLHAWQMEVRLPNKSGQPESEWTRIQAPIPDDFRQYEFGWNRWDEGANETLGSWQVMDR